MTEVATLEDYDQGMDSRASSCAGYPHQPCRIQVTRADGSEEREVLSMAADLSAADLSAADSAIEAASSGAVPRALRVEELLYEADKNISRSGSFSSLSGDTSGTDGDVDSRPNSGEAPLEPPSEDLIKKIVDQVEFYFSDENILKDAFLLKHVRRNKQGFVSLKLITSFKRIKSLTKDYRVVAVALRAAAEKLEVNAEGTKVKRIDPLPDYDETTTSRTVIAMRLPLEGEPTFDDVANLFKKCGEIVLIRIVKHGGVVPSDLKQYIHKHPEIGKETCSVIEFDTHAAAQRACALGLPMDDDGGGGDTGGGGGGAGLMVALLQPPRGKKNPLSKPGKSSGAATAGGDDDNNNPNNHKKDRKLKKKNDRLAAIAGDSPAGSSAASDSESEFLSANESDGVRNGRHSHHRQPHSNKENSPGRADRHGNWRSPAAATASPTTTTATTTMTTTIQDKGKAQRYTPGSSPTNTPKSTPKSSPQASPRMQRRSQGSQPQQQQQQQQQQNSRTNTGTDSPPTQSQPARRSGARPSPMSSPEAIRRRRSAGAIAQQQQQQQGLVVGVSPLAQESAGGTRSPPSGSSPPRATGDAAVGDNSAGKPPVYPPSTATAGGDLGMSPWVQRRLQEKEKSSTAAADTSAEGAGGSNATAGTASPGRSNSPAVHRRRTDAPPRLLDSLGVVRQPRGPDGTKGFHPGAREALTWPPFAAVAAS